MTDLPAHLARILTNLDLRDDAIRSLGCIACRLQGHGYRPCEKHHLNEGDTPGRKRRGERFTVGLCQWHHVGRCECPGSTIMRAFRCPACAERLGPSWVYAKREFLTRYGSGDELLAIQNHQMILQAQGLLR